VNSFTTAEYAFWPLIKLNSNSSNNLDPSLTTFTLFTSHQSSFPEFRARLEIFTAMKFHVVVFWVMTVCSVTVGFHRFGGPRCLHLQEGDSVVLQNFVILL
jgi:fatty-acid desaturase